MSISFSKMTMELSKKKDRITNTQDNCAGFYFVKRGILLEGNMGYDPKHAIKIRKDK